MNKVVLKIITNNYILIFTAFIFGVVSFFIDCKKVFNNEIFFFHRSGGFIAVIGAVMLFRRIIVSGFKEYIKAKYILDGGSSKNIDLYKINKPFVIAEISGTILVILGTLINSYGDLIFR